MRKTLIATTLMLAAGMACAADAPARKSGLWEITNNMSGPQQMTTTMQQCVDEKTDKLADQPGDMKQNCSKNDMSRSGGSNYRGDIRTTYNPPMHGMKDSAMVITAKWLGPCKPGMKPGDVMMQGMPGMPGGMKFNPADMQKQMR